MALIGQNHNTIEEAITYILRGVENLYNKNYKIGLVEIKNGIQVTIDDNGVKVEYNDIESNLISAYKDQYFSLKTIIIIILGKVFISSFSLKGPELIIV